jgi:hypothetical protein
MTQQLQNFDCLVFLRLAIGDDADSPLARVLKLVLAHYIQRSRTTAATPRRAGVVAGLFGIKALWADVAGTGPVWMGKTLGVFIDKESALRYVRALDVAFASGRLEAGGGTPDFLNPLHRLRAVLAAVAGMAPTRRYVRFDDFYAAAPLDDALAYSDVPSAPPPRPQAPLRLVRH